MTRIDSIAVYYLSLLADVRKAARACGYAVGIHGSLSRDFDLIAAPWTEDAVPAAELAEAVRVAVGGTIADSPGRNPGAKPHGRLAWTILLGEWTGGAFIDLSVMPREDDGRPCPQGTHRWKTHLIPSTPDQPPGERVCYCDACGTERVNEDD